MTRDLAELVESAVDFEAWALGNLELAAELDPARPRAVHLLEDAHRYQKRADYNWTLAVAALLEASS